MANDNVVIRRQADGSFVRAGTPTTRVGNRRRGALYYPDCRVLRTMLIEQCALDMRTGETTQAGEPEWVTQACGGPIFSSEEGHKDGICRSCRSGWSHPHNYFADLPPALDTILNGGVFQKTGEVAVVMARTSAGKTRIA